MNYYIENFKVIKNKLFIEGWSLKTETVIDLYFNNVLFDSLKLNKKRIEISKHFNTKDEKLGFSYSFELPKFTSLVKMVIRCCDDVIFEDVIKCGFIYNFSNKLKKIFRLIGKTFSVLKKHPKILISFKLLKKYVGAFFDKYNDKNVDDSLNPFDQKDYIEWLLKNENVLDVKYNHKYKPLISFILPVYNPNISDFKKCIESILNQSYDNFEVCLVDDSSTKKEVLEYISELEKDKRFKIKHNKNNMHIAKSSNKALKMANGEFIALIDHDDMISTNALDEVVKVINDDKNVDFIYSDYDKLDKNGLRCEPYFKSDYAPDTLLSFNYLSHFNVIRKSIVEKVGGFDSNYIGAQDYDLYLKIDEVTNKFCHIPKILYHWRMADNSTSSSKGNKNYAYLNGKKALEAALKRRNIDAEVVTKKDSSFYRINYKYNKEEKISIIIPTKDHYDILKKCIDSILKKTVYKNYEIIIVDNGTSDNKSLDLIEEYNKLDNVKTLRLDCEFNYSYLNNEAVKIADGKYLVLLNNDTEIITGEWLNIMVGYAMQSHVGTVGVKLLYPDNTIQHGGVVLGLGGIASHSFIGFNRYDRGFNGLLEVPTNYAANTAACLMVEKQKFLAVGGLSEELKVAYNDIDFNIKLLEKGYYNVFIPEVEVYHYESKSRGLDTTSEKYERFLKESNYMIKKWNNYLNRDPFYNPNYSLKSAYRLDKNIKVGEVYEKTK